MGLSYKFNKLLQYISENYSSELNSSKLLKELKIEELVRTSKLDVNKIGISELALEWLCKYFFSDVTKLNDFKDNSRLISKPILINYNEQKRKIVFEIYTDLLNNNEAKLELIINKGNAPNEVISDVLSDISLLYKRYGGSGLSFTLDSILEENNVFA